MSWHTIGTKEVFIVDSHHYVLEAWCDIYNRYGQKKLNIISFDYHTDTLDAFRSFASQKLGGAIGKAIDPAVFLKERMDRISAINVADPNSVKQAIFDLTWDEHIDCAINLDIIENFFLSLGRASPGNNHNGVKVFSFDSCHPNCRRKICNASCEKERADLVVDSSILESRIVDIFNVMGNNISPLIVDIDLDVFNTFSSIEDADKISFMNLLRKADCITIAREAVCVKDYALNRRPLLTALWLEKEVCKIIENL